MELILVGKILFFEYLKRDDQKNVPTKEFKQKSVLMLNMCGSLTHQFSKCKDSNSEFGGNI